MLHKHLTHLYAQDLMIIICYNQVFSWILNHHFRIDQLKNPTEITFLKKAKKSILRIEREERGKKGYKEVPC